MTMPQEPDGWSSTPEPGASPSQAPPPRVLPWSRRTRVVVGSLAAAGIAAGLAVGGAAVADASSDRPVVVPVADSPSATPAPVPPGGKAFGRWFGGPAGALHGQFVVPKESGGYETLDMQRGKVTSVSQDALTLRSDDGYTKSYVIGADTLVNGGRDGIGSVKNSDEVVVVASGGGDKPAAASVTDVTTRQAAHERWGFGEPHG